MTPPRVTVVGEATGLRRQVQTALGPIVAQVAGCAGPEALVAMCTRARPDVLVLAVAYPDAATIAAIAHLMAYRPTPILLVVAAAAPDEAHQPAIAAGAVAVLAAPAGHDPDWPGTLRSRVAAVARVPVIRHLREKFPAARPRAAGPFRLVALGASTGGPTAIARVLGDLPASFPLPVLVALHLGEPGGVGFAAWLQAQTALPVREARNGEPLPRQAGVLVVPANRHMACEAGWLRLEPPAPEDGCRPSIDRLFSSLARELGPAAIAGLLTGMGRDGAEGLLAIKLAGGATLAQDEASCAVFGMPREAIRRGAVGRVLPIDRFAAGLQALALGRAARPGREPE